MMRIILLLISAIVLTGCSSIMRPPPAAAFMDTYGQKQATNAVALSVYAGNLENSVEEKNSDVDIENREWWADAHFAHYISDWHYSFGIGLQSFTGFVQGGLVSPYFGLNAWSNINAAWTPLFTGDRNFWTQYSGGAMMIEQVPFSNKWAIGVTQHIARNGREVYEDDHASTISIDTPTPKFYNEFGGGFYVRYKTENTRIALEFRYGRDFCEDRNRFSLTIDIWGFSNPAFTGNGIMRSIAQKEIQKHQQMKVLEDQDSTTSDSVTRDTISLHKIPARWFQIKDSSKVISQVYTSSPDDRHFFYTEKICYDESQKEVWFKQDYGFYKFAVPLDSIDYCEEVKKKVSLSASVLSGTLIGLLGGVYGASSTGFFIATGIGTVSSWALFKALDITSPVFHDDLCKQNHSSEETENWLKQYSCSDMTTGEKQNSP